MKFKYLMIVSLLLAILTIGAVSASEDILTDDELAIDEEIDEIEESVQVENEELQTTDDEEDVMGEDSLPDAYIADTADLFDEDKLVYISAFGAYDGVVKVYVNESLGYEGNITKMPYDNHDEWYYLTPENVNITKAGDYKINVTYNDQPLKVNMTHINSYSFKFYTGDEDDSYDIYHPGETINFFIKLPSDITNKVTVKFNGKNYEVSITKGKGKLSVSTVGMSIREYEAQAIFNGDSIHPAGNTTTTLKIVPETYTPKVMSVGEDEVIIIKIPSGSGNVTLYRVYNADSNISYEEFDKFKIVDGVGTYSLSKLKKGVYDFQMNYTIGDYTGGVMFYFTVFENSKNIKGSVKPTLIKSGEKVTVKLKGPKLSHYADIYVDGKLFKSLKFTTGEIKKTISGLSVGTHRVKIVLDDGYTNRYSKTFLVTVKKATKIVAKKQTFKKAKKVKKYTIKLKSGKKALKKFKVTLKVNGKKYKAKTNKKGKATFKINKLKKRNVFKAVIKFKGTEKYMACTKKVKLTVK